MIRWISASLNRKLIFAMAAGLIIVSAAFAVLFVAIYRAELEGERSRASVQINRLLQASLENAMLKRDLEGLRDIVRDLGAQDDVRQVMIVNPAGEVRFSSSPNLLGHRFAPTEAASCSPCHADGVSPSESTLFTNNENGHAVLRSVNAVRNKAPCTECHGPVDRNPVNGVLFVDYDAEPIRHKALYTAVLFSGSGALVILLTLLGAWWSLRRFVLLPVQQLDIASHAFANGRLETRVDIPGADELARLGSSFNHMAASLQTSWGALQDNEAFLQGLIDAVPDGIRVISEDFSIVMVNQAYCTQLGVSGADATKMTCYRSSHRRQEPCCPTMVRCPLVEIGRGSPSIKCFHQHVRQDGSDFLVEVVAAPLEIGRKGLRKRFIVESIRDLTQAIQYSHEQRLAELGQLAAGVAHEVHNPLASIRLSVQAMLREARRNQLDRAQLQGYLTAADAEIQSCIEVTERLLKLSTPPGSNPDIIEVNCAIVETMSILRHEADDIGINISFYLHPSNPRTLKAQSDLRMVLLNLAQNAFHAMPEGGRLRVSSLAQCGDVQISFEDTGVGIDPEIIPHIYEPFFSHRADGVAGTGLGLPICKAIVKRYGGSIRLKTRLGEGARFTITLPSAEKQMPDRQLVAEEASDLGRWG